MTDLEELIRDTLSEEAGRARFDHTRWTRPVGELPPPRGVRSLTRRRIPRAVTGLAAGAVLIAAIAVPLAVLSRFGTDPEQARPGSQAFERYGIRFDVPQGWDSLVSQLGDTRYVLLANFEIPPSVDGFSSELRDGLRADQVTVFLQELTTICPCPGFDEVEIPLAIRPADMTRFEGVPNEHTFGRRTFVSSERWFDVWVEFGTSPAPDALLDEVNDVLAAVQIAPESGWVMHEDRDDAVAISVPESWTWREDPVPRLAEPRILFAAGTWDFPAGGVCGPGPALEELPADGAFLWLHEYRAPENIDDFSPRPSPFTLSGQPTVAECSTAYPTFIIRFRDGFRFFQFHVALGDAVTDATRTEVVDILNSMSPRPLPQNEALARSLDLCERLPWSRCPLADWVMNTIWEAGFAVDGRTGSAIIGTADGTSFYMWTTTDRGELEPGYVPLMEVDSVPVLTDGIRAVWSRRGIRVWVEAGPTDRALPSQEGLEPLVRASLSTPF